MAGNIFSIGKTALFAAQAGLSTTGHNIANANVVGYSRQLLVQESALAQYYGYGFVGNGTDVAYGASKSALLGLTRQAAFELAPAGITVNNGAPGPVGTAEFFRNTNEQIRAGIASLAPLDRLATPEEVAAGVAYIASREAAFITGATLAINGGIHMR